MSLNRKVKDMDTKESREAEALAYFVDLASEGEVPSGADSK